VVFCRSLFVLLFSLQRLIPPIGIFRSTCVFSGVPVYSILIFMCMFCWSLFVLLFSLQRLISPIGIFRSTCVFSGVPVYSILSFMCMLCRSLFVLLSFFLLVIVLSVHLWFTSIDIFKLFLKFVLRM
jgi:hypothetical protein